MLGELFENHPPSALRWGVVLCAAAIAMATDIRSRRIPNVLTLPLLLAGLIEAVIARGGYPDHFALKKGHKYFDEAGTADAPVWYMVDIAFAERFPAIVSLETLKVTPGLEQMMVTQKGSRLSIQPVTPAEYEIVVRLGRAGAAASKAPAKPQATKKKKTAAGR